MRPLTDQINDAVLQYSEGAITYGEFMAKIFQLLPPPCDDVTQDTWYSPLAFGINFALMCETAENEKADDE